MKKTDTALALHLPKAVCEQLGVTANTPMEMSVKNGRLVLQPKLAARVSANRFLWLLPLVVSVVLSLGVYVYWVTQDIHVLPLSGGVSLGSFVIGVGLVAGMILFAGFFIQAQRAKTVPRIYWRNFPVITGALTIMLGLALVGGFWLLGQLFPGASFDRITAVLIFWLFMLVVAAFMMQAAITLDTSMLANLLLVVIVSGMVIAMATNNTRRWWQHNLSFLGTDMASQAWQFNVTLILSALLFVALVDTLFVSLEARYPRSWKLWTMRIMLTLIGVDLGCIGLFPNNAASHLLHDQAAGMLVFLVAGLIVGCRWLLPEVTPEFLGASYVVAVALLVLNFGFRWFGWPSLTSFEIQAFVLAFGWLLVLFGRLEALVDQGSQTWDVQVIDD
ncbi:AbrB/MazE/SpoVT family DNA-binding domain-containing protein [Lacticaseibacillus sp. N501-2]|uniref:AbrB/MazE/SpoVT family DNA-binding domain-containing protein n=1 Tax=Lacticaseibacillus salsurae TaxID=3367729 RepID=UPI0038B24177